MQNPDTIAVLDFGGQYAHLITNRIRRLGVHAVIADHDTSAEKLKNYKGLILSGGPQSVNADEALLADPAIFELGIPVLGICYGHQVTNKILGGTISPGTTKEYGKTKLIINKFEGIFADLDSQLQTSDSSLSVWMSHWDEVTDIPVDFEVLAHTDINDFAAVGNQEKHIYGIQFHPEVTHTEQGMKILENFVNLTGAEKTWTTSNYLSIITDEVKEHVEKMNRKVFLLVSGGVDSVVAFTLLNKVLGKENVYGMLVDTGFMRKGEVEEVQTALKEHHFDNLHVYDAKEEFYNSLKGISDPEEKRAIIGKKFIEIQGKAVHELDLNPDEWMLGQGTIYPDTIESGATKHAAKIKTHHNRVPEIDALIEQGLVIEPLKDLYKDEVRELGEALGLPHHLVWRHPFPGPGLAIRMLCTPEKTNNSKAQNDDQLINNYLSPKGFAAKILPVQSVGVQGDARTYRHPVAIWATDENWKHHWNAKELQEIATELTNRFESVNRVIISLNGPINSSELIAERYLTPERTQVLQEADSIVMNAIMTFDEQEKKIWQCPTVLLPISANNTNNESILIRPVSSIDAMTADAAMIPSEELNKIIDQLSSISPAPSAIFYDLTKKPPGTIEWE
ncbi:MAG: glutamine-hydrolyzing GMP synthase [Candidatus Gracilibacteria bacterium]|nr:glutamine-hydrolyzing GMP synthase [Candidatus Gracilibacteria bacterium]